MEGIKASTHFSRNTLRDSLQTLHAYTQAQ